MRRLLSAVLIMAGSAARADAPVIEAITAQRSFGQWRFEVTVSHPDAGWDHYADAWEVQSPEGEVLGTRELLHPHETEQPFTRSLGGVRIPAGVSRVLVRAHDSVHGWGKAVEYDLPE